ncbi:hypothetical protein, partial [Asaia siamensis]|uniref:hypothetical protein n=1 Tax=Asaia siamensis TaxID=110479 RepID=UPI00222F22B7
ARSKRRPFPQRKNPGASKTDNLRMGLATAVLPAVILTCALRIIRVTQRNINIRVQLRRATMNLNRPINPRFVALLPIIGNVIRRTTRYDIDILRLVVSADLNRGGSYRLRVSMRLRILHKGLDLCNTHDAGWAPHAVSIAMISGAFSRSRMRPHRCCKGHPCKKNHGVGGKARAQLKFSRFKHPTAPRLSFVTTWHDRIGNTALQ